KVPVGMGCINRNVCIRAARQPHLWCTRRIRRTSTAFEYSGSRQYLRAMAYRGDRLAGIIEMPHDLEHTLVHAQILGRTPARDHEPVVIRRINRIEIVVQREAVPGLL